MKEHLTELQNSEESLRKQLTRESFWAFYELIFSESIKALEGKFVDSDHFKVWCDRLQNNKKTSMKSARLHCKSTVLHAWIMWKMWTIESPYTEGLYLSYKADLAAYQLKTLNRYIEVNPYFNEFERMTPADTIINYRRGNCQIIVEPEGIMSFKRGRHPHFVLCDDILHDPQTKISIDQINKITTIFREQVQSLPKSDGDLHVVGTPQDEQDLFYHLEQDESFKSDVYTAIKNDVTKEVLWPEMYDYEKLKQIEKSITKKAFQKEYMCVPVRSSESFFTTEELKEVVNPQLENCDPYSERASIYDIRAGFDIGKKRHPSHLSVFENKNGKLIQILSYWMDGWAYVDQIEFLKEVIKNLNIDVVYYDATRGEFESFDERSEMPEQMTPFIFSAKSKHSSATNFEKRVENKTIELINDERQFRQVINCDNDLKSIETSEGHGDSFWSNAMAIESFEENEIGLRWVG